jgi:hypothetical protein
MTDEYDELQSQINRYDEERRTWYSAQLAAVEERFTSAETAVWEAVQAWADRGEPERCNHLLRDLAELRAELNEMWAELDSPAPKWEVFHCE